MKHYYRIILGRRNANAAECVANGYIGIDYDMPNMAEWVSLENSAFDAKVREALSGKDFSDSKIRESLACGVITKFVRRIRTGDAVICPMGDQTYRVGEVTGGYFFADGKPLPHRRPVEWGRIDIRKEDMSEALRGSVGGSLTIIGPDSITRHSAEIDQLRGGNRSEGLPFPSRPDIEDPIAFAMEKHLEDFLVRNWSQTELSREFAIYEDEGELVGQQFSTDVGPIDLLAVSHDKKRVLVIELKRGRASDVVVGQLMRYMGYVKKNVAEPGQEVEGCIIALDDDPKIRWALEMAPKTTFYKYEIRFQLNRVSVTPT